ncbi:protein CNPPD1-like [Limulus polyphemus]|uniref:Protein CNPPD1 n=1 Tax=Limulus polyphemus TaxID=6850 RepID=A0ABM1BA97_LIMPO|nr:protein CNPPD1-like [Limulus polyphemus]
MLWKMELNISEPTKSAHDFISNIEAVDQIFKDHEDLTEQVRKTLCYGTLPSADRPSLPLTEIAVEMFSKSVRKGLEVLDLHYAATVSRQACISPCSMMLAMVYLERIRHCNPEYLQKISSCDLFLVSMMVASKFLYDNGEEDEVFNDEWAASANMDLKDLNRIEREFLTAIDWNVFVQPSQFFQVLKGIETEIASKEILKRGWLTYTDVEVLLKTIAMDQWLALLMERVVKVVVVSTVTYTAAVLTLIGASGLVQRCCLPSTQLILHTFDSQIMDAQDNLVLHTDLNWQPSVLTADLNDLQNQIMPSDKMLATSKASDARKDVSSALFPFLLCFEGLQSLLYTPSSTSSVNSTKEHKVLSPSRLCHFHQLVFAETKKVEFLTTEQLPLDQGLNYWTSGKEKFCGKERIKTHSGWTAFVPWSSCSILSSTA